MRLLRRPRSQGKPVFVDFTAAWCLSCQVNEKAVLQDKSVEQEFVRQHYVLLRADWTRYDPEITNELGASGAAASHLCHHLRSRSNGLSRSA